MNDELEEKISRVMAATDHHDDPVLKCYREFLAEHLKMREQFFGEHMRIVAQLDSLRAELDQLRTELDRRRRIDRAQAAERDEHAPLN
jgi:hypothetical protein